MNYAQKSKQSNPRANKIGAPLIFALIEDYESIPKLQANFWRYFPLEVLEIIFTKSLDFGDFLLLNVSR